MLVHSNDGETHNVAWQFRKLQTLMLGVDTSKSALCTSWSKKYLIVVNPSIYAFNSGKQTMLGTAGQARERLCTRL
jgi:hypothetical protein